VDEPEEPPKGKAAKTSAPEPNGLPRFSPPSAEGGAHYEISEDGRRAVGKDSDSNWTALGRVLAVGEAVAFKMAEEDMAGLVGLAPPPSTDGVWDGRYGLEGQAALGEVRGSIGLSHRGNLKFNGEQGPSDLATFGVGDVIELRRIGEYLYRWSKDGEVVIEHEAPRMRGKVANDPDSLCWGVTGSGVSFPEDPRAVWEIVEVRAAAD
jgi:hypothetical protein